MKRFFAAVAFASLVISACTGPPPAPPSATPLAALTSPPGSAAKSSVPPMGHVPAPVPGCPVDLSTPLFDTMPLEPDDFMAWRPLGFLSPPIHIFPAKHSSFSMTLPGGTPPKKAVKAPGTVWVTEVWAANFSTGGSNFQVYFYPCRDVRAYFYHLSSVSEKLAAEMKTRSPRCNSFEDGTATVTTCRYEGMAIPFEPGEQVGVGTDTSGVDFGAIDFRVKPAAFANVEHYSFEYPYYVSPVNYYPPEVQARFASRSGSVFGNRPRTAEPRFGSYMQDVMGTAQGNWFSPGISYKTNTDISSAMALVHDYVDPIQPIFSMGTSIKNVKMGLYSFKIETDGLVNRDFGEVRSDGTAYCYDGFQRGTTGGGMGLGQLSGILILTLPSDGALKIELIDGSSCRTTSHWAFTEKAVTFER